VSPRFDTVTERTVWELLSSRQSIDRLVKQADEDDWDDVHRVLAIVADYTRKFMAIERQVLDDLDAIDRNLVIEDQFVEACTSSHPHVLHSLLGGEDYAAEIWALLEPARVAQ
jgi:hypothetical protein